MLNKDKPIKDCTAQELVAALMLQSTCDALSPEQVVQDLSENAHLWRSFWMGPLLPLDDDGGLPLMLIFLRDLNQFWHANTLYILAKSEDCVPTLQKLGFSWNCDTIRVVSGKQARMLLGDYENENFLVVCWWD